MTIDGSINFFQTDYNIFSECFLICHPHLRTPWKHCALGLSDPRPLGLCYLLAAAEWLRSRPQTYKFCLLWNVGLIMIISAA